MTLFHAGLSWWAMLAIVASAVIVSVGGPRVQARHPMLPLAVLTAFAAGLAGLVAYARWSGPGARAEAAVLSMIGLGLPAVASLTALAVFRRVAPRIRVAIALLAGGAGCVYGFLTALLAACGLFGNCL